MVIYVAVIALLQMVLEIMSTLPDSTVKMSAYADDFMPVEPSTA